MPASPRPAPPTSAPDDAAPPVPRSAGPRLATAGSGRLTVRLRRPVRFSRLLDVRPVLVVTVLALAVAALALYGLTLGGAPVALPDVLRVLAGGGDPGDRMVVLEFLLPRILTAIGVGAALGLSGALFQGVARNPLVSPDIIGINNGAALAVVPLLVLYGGTFAVVPYGAFAGALAAAATVYLCSRVRGLSPYRLVLVGIGVDAACRAGVSMALVQGDIDQVQSATVWMLGSLYLADEATTVFLAVALLVLVPPALGARRALEALRLGDDVARAVGARPERARTVVLVTGTLLAASAVAVCGPVAFVAFLAPHLARRLCRAEGGTALAASAAVGALLVLGSDLTAQYAFPVILPLGVLTPLIGGPYFLYLLLRANRRGEVA